MELIITTADEVAEAYRVQKDYMELFADFLVHLNCAYMKLLEAREQADRLEAAYDEPVPRGNFFKRIRARQLAGEQGFNHNTGLRGQLSGLPWGDDYMAQVQDWAAHLEWPPLPCHPGKDVGVSYLELAIHFAFRPNGFRWSAWSLALALVTTVLILSHYS